MEKKYKDLFIDFDDTLYDTYGNAVISLGETFEAFHLERYFPDPQVFYGTYWAANIDLWSRYARGEITRDFLIVERFRRPLSAGSGLEVTEQLCLQMGDKFLDFCATKPGVVDGAHELMDYLKGRGYRMHMTSNGFHEVQYRKLTSCGLIDYFDTISYLIASLCPGFVAEIIASIDGEHSSCRTIVGDVIVARAVLLTIVELDARNLSLDKDIDG